MVSLRPLRIRSFGWSVSVLAFFLFCVSVASAWCVFPTSTGSSSSKTLCRYGIGNCRPVGDYRYFDECNANRLCLASLSASSASSASSESSDATCGAAADSPQQATAREAFHEDMRRVLVSRASAFEEYLKGMQQEQEQEQEQGQGQGQDQRLHLHMSDNHNDIGIRWQRRAKPIILDADLDGTERVIHMLRHLIDIQAATEESFQIAFNAVVQRGRLRWKKQDENNTKNTIICAADQAEELLQLLQQTMNAAPETISLKTYNFVLQAYAVCSTPRGDRNYAQRARDLLQKHIETQHQDKEKDKEKDADANEDAQHQQQYVQSLLFVCQAYAWQQENLSRNDECAQTAHDYLNQLATLTHDPKILLEAHGYVLEAWSKTGTPGSADKAQKLLDTCKTITTHLAKSSSAKYQSVDMQFYSNAILAWSKDANNGSAEKAQALLDEMIQLHQSASAQQHTIAVKLPLIAFNGVITAWVRSERPDKAEQVLWMMHDDLKLPINAVSINTIMHGYLKSRDKQYALNQVLKLINVMKQQQRTDTDTDSDSYDTSTTNTRTSKIPKPNAFSYNTLLKCYIQNTPSRPELAEHAEQILMQMEKLWKAGDKSLEPSNRIFNMVINAYAKSNHPDAASKAVQLLQRMKETAAFAAATTAKGNNNHHHHHHNNHQYSKCQPDIISYTSAIECCSKSHEPSASMTANALFEEAMQSYQKSPHDNRLMPNLRTYTMTILTLANHGGDPAQARALLEQLLNHYQQAANNQKARELLQPNTYPYNYVLNCAANTIGDKTLAFQIATQTYQEMRKSTDPNIQPNAYTYAFWIKCCNNLLQAGSDLKNKCIQYAFEECKQKGLVSNEVLTRLYQASPPSLVDQLLHFDTTTTDSRSSSSSSSGSSFGKRTSSSIYNNLNRISKTSSFRSFKIHDLPKSWSRNI